MNKAVKGAGKSAGKKSQTQLNGLLIGNRIPRDFFRTKGKGESNITIHAGSYHLALKDAGIETCNVITYSSILPGIAREIPKPKSLVHGSVMETIMAVADSTKGKRATAGIITGWLFDKKTGEKFGGLVCEYHGELTVEAVGKQLRESINELYQNGFSDRFDLKEIKLVTESFVPKKKFGTAMVVIGFVNYVYPKIA